MSKRGTRFSIPSKQRPLAGVVRKFEEVVPAQVSSSSSDRGSKLRGPSQNSPRVASKRDVNKTKLNQNQTQTFQAERRSLVMEFLFHSIMHRMNADKALTFQGLL
ncbi:hypothetical protein AVEN_213548-1 [Araneus ventricosus]|uniref:Uncharacterized protein n=1 Tax=Araneus ventricosus TaxID=182803 RepID=A0A4Y2PWH6_ARAVE|nr:hypothetical protein AVEN_213548-1 [Araneus ventricosus]